MWRHSFHQDIELTHPIIIVDNLKQNPKRIGNSSTQKKTEGGIFLLSEETE